MELFKEIESEPNNLMRYLQEDIQISYEAMEEKEKILLRDYVTSKMATKKSQKDEDDMMCKLRNFAEVFVLISKLFSDESRTYAEFIFPTLEVIDSNYTNNTTAGLLKISLYDFPKLLSNAANVNLNLRTIVKGEEKKTPYRKHPAVIFFESLVVLLCFIKGQFEENFLCDSPDSFLSKFPVFNPLTPERVILSELDGKFKDNEKEKLLRSKLDDNQLKSLVRAHNIMAVVVMITKNKRFKACALSVRIAEGPGGKGFKPGGDNNARVIRLILLHQLLHERKVAFIASLSSPISPTISPPSQRKKAKKTKKVQIVKRVSPRLHNVSNDDYDHKTRTKRNKEKFPVQKKATKQKCKNDLRRDDSSLKHNMLSTSVPPQQLFLPFSTTSSPQLPLYDEIDDAIVQTVSNDDFAAEVMSSSFLQVSSLSENGVVIDEEDHFLHDQDAEDSPSLFSEKRKIAPFLFPDSTYSFASSTVEYIY